jgi:spermidine/putrescine transport system substrate-binding protein
VKLCFSVGRAELLWCRTGKIPGWGSPAKSMLDRFTEVPFSMALRTTLLKKETNMKTSRLFTVLAIAAVILPSMATSEETASQKMPSKVLNVYNWEDYFGETTLSDFEKRFGAKVNLATFGDEEELFASLQSDPSRYDVIITSDSSILELRKLRLLAEIDMKRIPNIENIDPKFRNPAYDPGHKYSVPYLWGTTGIVVNRKFVADDDDSWGILWNPKYAGKIAMLNSPDEVMGAAFKYLGYPLNTRDSSRLEKARQILLEQSPLITGYLDVITIKRRMISNELWAAQVYSGEGISAADSNEALEYIIPREGAAIWIDCLAIPRDAQHRCTAEVFVNYILEPEVSGKIASYLWYANCNKAAQPYTDKEILKSACVYPPEEILRKCEFFCQGASMEEDRRFYQTLYKTWAELRLKKRATEGEDK